MSSKREEERNEKIIRGLMKLPPNRRCINCNSLGPQYVCTNFWTFVCITCSGIHREFTHRVKSVSMAKFTSQEVDALQNGGNQRARELFLKTWDPQKNRLPDNSNADKVREFIKKVYVDKLYFQEKSTDRPPRDPQSLRSHEDQTRRASSYHSYSQSPPYDFQYEERRYGKHGPSLTRKPGSDRGLYEGKLASFLSPTRLSDHSNDERFANDPRFSDFSVSGALSPSSQRGSGSPFSETSRDISNTQLHKVLQSSDANNTSHGGKILHQQVAGASGSFVSFDSDSLDFPEVISKPEQRAHVSPDKSSSLPSLPQNSVSMTFDELDLFTCPFPQQKNNTLIQSGNNTQLPHSSSTPSLNTAHQLPISSGPTFTGQEPSKFSQPLDFFPGQKTTAYSNGKACDVIMPNDGEWATFDMPQNVVSMGSEKSDGDVIGSFNPFSVDESFPYMVASGHEPSRAFGNENLQKIEAHPWSAFDDPAGGQPIHDLTNSDKQASVPYASDADNSLGFGVATVYEVFNNDGNVSITNESEHQSSSLSTNSSMTTNGFPMVSAVAGLHSCTTDYKPGNPFDLPYDSDMESSNVFWNMSSLQAALPNTRTPPSYSVNQSWDFQDSVPSYSLGGVPLGSTSGSLGFMTGQASSTQVPSIVAEGPVASIGGNPFA